MKWRAFVLWQILAIFQILLVFLVWVEVTFGRRKTRLLECTVKPIYEGHNKTQEKCFMWAGVVLIKLSITQVELDSRTCINDCLYQVTICCSKRHFFPCSVVFIDSSECILNAHDLYHMFEQLVEPGWHTGSKSTMMLRHYSSILVVGILMALLQ